MARDLARVRVRADDESKGAFDSFKRNISESVTGINGLGAGVSRLTGFLAALGFTVSVGGLGMLASQAIDAHASLDDLSEMTSLTVETLSSLDRVAYIGGRRLEDISPVATKFAKSVAEAAGGNKQLLASFDALGISQERLRTSKFDELYIEFADKIANATNRTYAIGHATDLAGKAAAGAIPHFRDVAEEGLKLGRVTAEQASAAEALQKEWRRLTYDAGQFRNELATHLIPVMTNLVGLMRELKASGGFASGIGQALGIGLSPDKISEQINQTRAKLESPDVVSRVKGALGFGEQDEASLRRRLQILQLLQRQQALALGGPGSYDANDLRMLAAERKAYDLPAPPSKDAKSGGESPYHGLAKGLAMQESDLARQIGYMEKLTALDKLKIDLDNMKPEQLARLTAAERFLLETQAATVAHMEQELRAREHLKRANEAYTASADQVVKTQEEWDKVLGDFNTTQSESRQQLEFETKLLGLQRTALGDVFMSQDQLRKLQLDYDVERETSIALRRLELDFIKKTTGATEEQYDELKKLYDLERERLPDGIKRNREAQFAVDTLQKSRDEARATADDINRSITDGLMRGFEGGKDIAGNFFDTIENMAKTLVLRPVIQWVVSPLSGAISAALGGLGIPGLAGASGAAADAGGGGGGGGGFSLSNLSGIASIGNALTGGLANASTMAGITAGNLFGGSAAAFSIGSAIPYVGLALGALALGKSLFGSKKSPAVGTGYQYLGSYAPGQGFEDFQALGHYTAGSRSGYDVMNPAADLLAPLNKGLDQVLTQMRGLAKVFGADPSTLSSARFDFTTSGIGQAAQDTAIEPIIRQISGQWAEQLVPNLRDMAQANEELIDTFKRLATARRQADLDRSFALMSASLGLADRTRDLWLSDLSPLTNAERLSEAGSAYTITRMQAGAGDVGAMSRLADVARGYLTEARQFYASSPDYTRIFSEVQGQIGGLVSSTLSQQSLHLVEMGVSLNDIQANTQGLDARIAGAIGAAEQATKLGALGMSLDTVAGIMNAEMQAIVSQGFRFDTMVEQLGRLDSRALDQALQLTASGGSLQSMLALMNLEGGTLAEQSVRLGAMGVSLDDIEGVLGLASLTQTQQLERLTGASLSLGTMSGALDRQLGLLSGQDSHFKNLIDEVKGLRGGQSADGTVLREHVTLLRELKAAVAELQRAMVEAEQKAATQVSESVVEAITEAPLMRPPPDWTGNEG